MDLMNARPILEWLSQSRDFMGIHNIDATMWQRALWATELNKIAFTDQHENSVPGLLEPDFTWDERDYSAQSDRWGACMSMQCFVSVLCVMGGW